MRPKIIKYIKENVINTLFDINCEVIGNLIPMAMGLN